MLPCISVGQEPEALREGMACSRKHHINGRARFLKNHEMAEPMLKNTFILRYLKHTVRKEPITYPIKSTC